MPGAEILDDLAIPNILFLVLSSAFSAMFDTKPAAPDDA